MFGIKVKDSLLRLGFPDGIQNAFLFGIFNAFSFQIVLGTPVILYAKTLGASETVLGVISGMMPLLVVLQIPAASYVVRVGYKKFVLAGWGTRVFMIFLMSIIPLIGSLIGHVSTLSVLLMLLFLFNLSRGISSCAWLPWITSLVPEKHRGKYLMIDSACVNASSLVIFILVALILGKIPESWKFSLVFLVSAVNGFVSLLFLKKIPEVETPDQVRVSAAPVPWGEIIGYKPFKRVLIVNFFWSIGYGGLTAFIAAYLKSIEQFNEMLILLTFACSYIGGLCNIWLFWSRLDHYGSKPILQITFLLWIILMISWVLVTCGLLPRWVVFIGVLQFSIGLASSASNMALTRLAMCIVPVMGRNHFFALFSVVGNVTQGIAPVLWGILIDSMSGVTFGHGHFTFNKFSIFFGLVAIVFIVTLLSIRKIEEPKSLALDKLLQELLLVPTKFWFRFWPRT